MAGNPPDANEGPVLSQSEVENLLSQVQAQESLATVIKSGGAKAQLNDQDIQPFDFRQPAFLTSAELRKLRLRHEDFLRVLASHLSMYLRLEVAMQMSKLQTVSFQKYAEALPAPTHVTLFKVEPLKGICLLDTTPRLGLTIVDRLLGGPAHSSNASGELSEIEVALLDQVVQIILNEWCQLWPGIGNARPVLLGHENNGRFLNSSPHDTPMLVVSVEVRFGDCVEPLQLAFPFFTIEPIVRQPGQAAEAEAAAPAVKRGPVKWNENLDDISIRVNTEWEGLELSARDLANLKAGDVLMLDASCFNRVEVRLEQVPRFHGRLGTSGERWAVELTETAKT